MILIFFFNFSFLNRAVVSRKVNDNQYFRWLNFCVNGNSFCVMYDFQFTLKGHVAVPYMVWVGPVYWIAARIFHSSGHTWKDLNNVFFFVFNIILLKHVYVNHTIQNL